MLGNKTAGFNLTPQLYNVNTDCLLPLALSTPPNSEMSLDQNLFTLHLTPHKDYPNVIDLIDPAGTIHYRKQRVAGSEYRIEVYGEHKLSTPKHMKRISSYHQIHYPNPF